MKQTRQLRAARRPGADAAVDLRTWRRWFDGEGEEAPTQPADGDSATDTGDGPPAWVQDPVKAYAEIQRLRAEAADGRQAKKKLTDAEKAAQAAEEARLAEQNEFKKLAEQRAAKIAELEAAAQAATLKAMQLAVATEYGLPPALAARLQGATEEELKADAETLKGLIPAGPQAPQTPVPGGRQQTTTPVPGGPPAGETDTQRRARLFGGQSGMFSGGGVVFHGNAADLDQPVNG